MNLRRVLGFLFLMILAWGLSACGKGGSLPEPPVGGGNPGSIAPPKVTLPASGGMGGVLPEATIPNPANATMPATPGSLADVPQWQSVKTQASAIQQEAQEIGRGWEQVASGVQWIQAHETDEEVIALASQMADLVAQTLQDAAQLAVTAGDINYRIDHSEATTLRLSDDIGVMADRIGEMADRILWTELQIGVMADRIVHSEHLINDGTQQTIDQMQETLDQIGALVRDIMAQSAMIQQMAGNNGGNTGDNNGSSSNMGNESTSESGSNAGNGASSSSGGTAGSTGSGAGGAGAAAGGASLGGGATSPATPQAPDRSPRRLEVLSRSLYLSSDDLRESLHQAKEAALSLQANDLAAALTQAEQAAAQVALVADDLNAYAKVADQLTPDLIARGQTAHAQIADAIQNLNAALNQAEAQARSLPADDPQAQSLRRILAAGRVTVEYLNRWDTEIATIVGP